MSWFPQTLIFVIPIVTVIAVFTMVAVVRWAEERRKEREAYYRYEFHKKLVDAGKMDAPQLEGLLRFEYDMEARRRRDSRFSTWIYTVALNHYRSAVRRHVPAGVRLDAIDPKHHAGDLARELDGLDRDDAVRRAVATLPPKYRDVVVLYYFNDRDLAETAAVTRLAQGTVKARLHRARALLESKLTALMSAPAVAGKEA
jgi:RNA polymerase sigma-70 factor (ECF subfamily)